MVDPGSRVVEDTHSVDQRRNSEGRYPHTSGGGMKVPPGYPEPEEEVWNPHTSSYKRYGYSAVKPCGLGIG
jgi:hypothetical protein